MGVTIKKTDNPKAKPDWNNLGFGSYFSDHMFLMDYSPQKGWFDARIVPYGNMEFSLATISFHYGQGVFEGLKAYKTADGKAQLFRPANNMARLNASCRRLCIPEIDEDFSLKALCELVKTEHDWIPEGEGTSLYLRPLIFATDACLGVRPSEKYLFTVICSPCGAYYASGMSPVKIYIETKYVRAVKGGVGEAKTEGNYAAGMKAQAEAAEKGYSQVLWLDGQEHKYVEEVGAMNVFFVIGDTIVTPSLGGSILHGVTRLSAIEILRDKGYKVEERRIPVEELIEGAKSGALKEAFGTGTAVVVAPIGEFGYNGVKYDVSDGTVGKISKELYDELAGIQYGRIEDKRGWVVRL